MQADPAGAVPAPFIDVADVSVTFRTGAGPVEALQDINLRAAPGSFVVIVGPSGCGKTTLLRLLAGLAAPSTGQLRIAGEVVSGPDRRRGMVFQRPTLYPWLNVRQNIEFGLMLRGVGAADRRAIADRHLDMIKLREFAQRRPYELSGGMQQRVAIARVLANDSEVLLMDEPFGALDALTREQLQEELLTIWRTTQRTIVFVTHSVEEAVYLGTQVLVMSPRPGRFLVELACPFSRRGGERAASRKVKSDPEFVKLREQVLEYIWQ